MIFLEFCDRALLLLSRLQMLVATKKEGGGGSEVNGQIPSRSSDIWLLFNVSSTPALKIKK